MTTTRSQRWRERREAWRRTGETIDPRRFGVEVLDREVARAFVERHHYAGTFVAARLSVGLFRSRGAFWAPELVGVAAFSVGPQPAAIPRWTGRPASEGVELGRLVLLDDVEANGETWFLSRAFGVLAVELPEVRAVLSYSDPVPRSTLDGRVVTPGHVGEVYQAFGGRYVGRSGSRLLHLDAEGRALSPRSLSKVRLGERGASAAYDDLVARGAPRIRPGEAPAAWVERVLREGPFRPVRHPGNHAYVWPVGHGKAATRAGLAPELDAPRRAA